MNEPRTVNRSPSIAALADALAKAQGKIKGAAKDSNNPFFKSKYADLASIWEAVRIPLSDNGLAVLQFPRTYEGGIELETILAHSSGEWMSDTLALPVAKEDAQGAGSAITYARRYALAAIAGVAPEDDDGNAAAESVKNRKFAKPEPVVVIDVDRFDQLDQLFRQKGYKAPQALAILQKRWHVDGLEKLTVEQGNQLETLLNAMPDVKRAEAPAAV